MTIAPRRQFVAIIVTTLVCWVNFSHVAGANQARISLCGVDSGYSPQCNFKTIAHRYPYCIVDPVCISPMATDATKYGYGYGLDNVGDPGVVAAPALMLAAPNLVLFIACIGLGVLFVATLSPDAWKRPLMVAIITWYLLEVCRWGEAVWRFAQFGINDRFLVQPATYLVLVGVLLPLGVCITAWRSALAV